jgi:hypothetical protein
MFTYNFIYALVNCKLRHVLGVFLVYHFLYAYIYTYIYSFTGHSTWGTFQKLGQQNQLIMKNSLGEWTNIVEIKLYEKKLYGNIVMKVY